MQIINCEQGTAEWEMARLGKLTGSKAYAISVGGKGLDTLCEQLAWDIVFGEVEKGFKNSDMQAGNDNEHFAADAYEIQFGAELHQIGFAQWNDYVGCSPDRLVGKDGLLEIKSKQVKGHRRLLLGKEDFEAEYIWQCHFQMLILDRQWCDLVSYNPKFGNSCLFVQRIVRDAEKDAILLNGLAKGEELIKDYEKKYREFLGI